MGLSLVVWLLSGLATILGAYCYVELGTSIRRSGGDFAYLSHVKWFNISSNQNINSFYRNAIAFTFMSMGCLISYPLMLAVQSATFAEYTVQGIGLDSMIGAKCHPMAAFALRKLIAFSCLWLLLFLNFFSLRTVVSRFQLVTSFAKLLSALLIVGIGAFWLIKG
jgi:amino acid transporter